MSQAQISSSSVSSLPQLAYKGTPVVTTETLAKAYDVKPINIQKNFSANKERFAEGKHYFIVSGQELSSFRLRLTESKSQISPKARALTLWTERGAARHAKMLNSDKAWDMFELLEETFFRVAAQQLPDTQELSSAAPLTPDQQCTLQALVKAKIEALPEGQRKGRGLYPQIWSRFNNHFRIARYCQLPQCRLSEAITYLTQMELAIPRKEELPAAEPIPSVLPGQALPPSVLETMTASQRARRFRKVLEEVHELAKKVGTVMSDARIWMHPGGRLTFLPPELNAKYNALDQMHKTAIAGLYQAEHMLYCLYFLGEGVDFTRR